MFLEVQRFSYNLFLISLNNLFNEKHSSFCSYELSLGSRDVFVMIKIRFFMKLFYKTTCVHLLAIFDQRWILLVNTNLSNFIVKW